MAAMFTNKNLDEMTALFRPTGKLVPKKVYICTAFCRGCGVIGSRARLRI